ncbi:DUF6418 domain-containing protein [Phytopseudomonas dryadis]|uniref:DUF6418 domain-containing protein n=1 Tax=Phytopseudomonas dryadis TaxID=2487520 RepID=UPI00103858F0|nr:DUF6418 domain-containing protein [Pseudomonas dryadis]
MLLSSEARTNSVFQWLFFPLFTVVLAGVWALVNVAFPSLYGAWFSAAFFVLYVLVYVRKSFSFVLLTCFVSYYYFALVLGAVSAESGIYMLEIKEQGQPNGAAALVLFFYTLFIGSVYLSWRFFSVVLNDFNFPSVSLRFERLLGCVGCVIVLLICMYLIYLYSSPVLMGIERSTFSAFYAPSWFSSIYSVFLQSFSVVILLWYFSSGGRKLYSVFVGVYFLFMFLVFGQKFSGMVLLLFAVLAVLGVEKRKLNFKFLMSLFGFGVLLFFLVCYAYISIGRDPLEFILARYALQGQLIWSVVSDPYLDFFSVNDLGCLIGDCSGYGSLINLVSARYLPVDVYQAYQAGGNKLSGFSPAAHVLAFGLPVSIVLCVLSAALYGAITAFWAAAVRSQNLLVSVLAYKLMFSIGYIYLVEAMPVLYGAAFWGTLYIFWALLVLALICSRQRMAIQPKG